jgi:hypothetical protein
MPGWGPIGQFAVGQIGGGAVQVALTARLTASARAKVTVSSAAALTSRANAQGKARGTITASSAVLGRIGAQAKMRAPAGFAISGKVAAQAKAKAPAGYAIYGRIQAASSAGALPHLIIQTNPARRALLLNSTSQFTASYWRGHS